MKAVESGKDGDERGPPSPGPTLPTHSKLLRACVRVCVFPKEARSRVDRGRDRVTWSGIRRQRVGRITKANGSSDR